MALYWGTLIDPFHRITPENPIGPIRQNPFKKVRDQTEGPSTRPQMVGNEGILGTLRNPLDGKE